MKKLVAFCTSVITAISISSAFNVSADENYSPTFYFSLNAVEEFEEINYISNNVIQISSDSISDSGAVLNIGVYIDDASKQSCAVSPKWKCADKDYVKLKNLVNPSDPISTDASEYITSLGQIFTTNLSPFPYAKINSDGSLKHDATVITNSDTDYNTMAITAVKSLSPMSVLGAATDEYALTYFDVEFSSNTPDGIYEIYFLTEPEDYSNQQFSTGTFMTNNLPTSYVPNVKSFTVIVGNYDYLLGDVNKDKTINAIDASMILTAYAEESTGNIGFLSDAQSLVADINKDSSINAVDASAVLSYYAYTSTGGTDSIVDFLTK